MLPATSGTTGHTVASPLDRLFEAKTRTVVQLAIYALYAVCTHCKNKGGNFAPKLVFISSHIAPDF